jgi:hypothetical protein
MFKKLQFAAIRDELSLRRDTRRHCRGFDNAALYNAVAVAAGMCARPCENKYMAGFDDITLSKSLVRDVIWKEVGKRWDSRATRDSGGRDYWTACVSNRSGSSGYVNAARNPGFTRDPAVLDLRLLEGPAAPKKTSAQRWARGYNADGTRRTDAKWREEEARRKAAEEARRIAEEKERLKAAEKARRIAEEKERLKAAEEARLKAEEEALIAAPATPIS